MTVVEDLKNKAFNIVRTKKLIFDSKKGWSEDSEILFKNVIYLTDVLGVVADLKTKYNSLHEDFIFQSKSWQKTIDKNKTLEGKLADIKQHFKKRPYLNDYPHLAPREKLEDYVEILVDWVEDLKGLLEEKK